jgi:hypothetical protein
MLAGKPTWSASEKQRPEPDRANCRGRVITSESQENGGNVTRPRAADDFPMIRARMEELRRERDGLSLVSKLNVTSVGLQCSIRHPAPSGRASITVVRTTRLKLAATGGVNTRNPTVGASDKS